MNLKMLAVSILLFVAPPVSPVDRAGRMAELFWDQFTTVQSVERVTQTRLNADGKVLSTRASEFDYVALLRAKAHGVAVEESRVPRFGDSESQPGELLQASGFPALLLLFHPDFIEKFEFQESPASDSPAGTVRVAFRSRPGERSMSALKLKGRHYPISWKGFAWIEESTGAVTRIEASLDAPMDDVGVSDLRTEVEYRGISFPNSSQAYHLPARVTVSVRTPKQQWRNIHEFSNYRLFTVTSSTRGEAGKSVE